LTWPAVRGLQDTKDTKDTEDAKDNDRGFLVLDVLGVLDVLAPAFLPRRFLGKPPDPPRPYLF
jgi:hypothetical protein